MKEERNKEEIRERGGLLFRRKRLIIIFFMDIFGIDLCNPFFFSLVKYS
jgi:hypothetical protein